MKHNKIALIGMMGCGKSSISYLLAQKLNYNLFELDEIFEKQENITIKDFFKTYGEDIFRYKEGLILKETSKKENIVISCGGGIVLLEQNRKILFNSNLTTIYLKTSINELHKRLEKDSTRPLLQVENPKKEIEEILKTREELYNLAKITITTDNKTKEEINQEIMEILWKN